MSYWRVRNGRHLQTSAWWSAWKKLKRKCPVKCTVADICKKCMKNCPEKCGTADTWKLSRNQEIVGLIFYVVLLQYVLLYCDLCGFVIQFCRDLRVWVKTEFLRNWDAKWVLTQHRGSLGALRALKHPPAPDVWAPRAWFSLSQRWRRNLWGEPQNISVWSGVVICRYFSYRNSWENYFFENWDFHFWHSFWMLHCTLFLSWWANSRLQILRLHNQMVWKLLFKTR